MTSTIILFKNIPLNEGKNYLIESLSGFLHSWDAEPLEVTSFQYLRIAREMEVKAALPQYLQSEKLMNYDYALIKNDDGPAFGFFVDSLQQVAKDTIRIKMTMDVLSSYATQIVKRNGDAAFGNKTLVFREHRNRFVKDALGNWIPKIDRIPENMGLPLIKRVQEPIVDENGGDIDWSLSYISDDLSNSSSISCVAYPSKELGYDRPIFTGSSTFDLKDHFNVGDAIYILASENNHADKIKLYPANPVDPTQHIGLDWEYGVEDGVEVVCLGYRLYKRNNDQYYYDALLYRRDLSFFKLKNVGQVDVSIGNPLFENAFKARFVAADRYDSNSISAIHGYEPLYPTSHQGTETKERVLLRTQDSIDRTSSSINKIVELPYRVFEYAMRYGVISPGEGIFVEDGKIVLSSNIELKSSFECGLPILIQSHFVAEHINEDGILYDLKNETKRFHSEFTQLKIAYDSFNYVIKMENEPSWKADQNIVIDYRFSSAMQNEMLFKISWNNIRDSLEEQDFERLFIANRSNETALYTSAYLEYIRGGYNFDVKRKDRDSFSNGMNLALSAISTIVSVGATIASGGAAAPTLAASLPYLGVSVANSVMTQKTRDEAMAQSIKTSVMQGSSIRESSDFDIMKAYNGNRAQFILYYMDPAYWPWALDEMRLHGYASVGRYVPNVRTRRYFNYLKCDADTTPLSSIPMEYRSEIERKFSEGVTIFHDANGTWDLEQIYENYEI